MKPMLSLTFDDGLTCQLDHAIPELDRRGLKGTFFLPTRCPDYPLDMQRWTRAAQRHEIGSHSVTHRKATQMTGPGAIAEYKNSRKFLETETHTPCRSFCYPYTDAPEDLQKAARLFYSQARGGRVAREDKYLIPGDGANLHNVPCHHVQGKVIAQGLIYTWVNEAIERGAWLTLMFHGVGQLGSWDNVPKDLFTEFLDYVSDKGIVKTFGEAADTYRGAK